MVDVAQSWAELQTQLIEAARKEKEARTDAWLSLPYDLCGVEIGHLTLRRYTLLESARNPFIVGGIPSGGAVVQFLWFLSTDFTTDPSARDRFTKRLSKYPQMKAVLEIREYLESVFFDAPVGKSTDAETKPGVRPLAAVVIHRLAKEYGWDAETILDMPLHQIFQLLSMMSEDAGKNVSAPLQDRLKAEWLERVNQGDN